MPLIYESSYTKRPPFHFNSYLETILPFVTTRIRQIEYERERLELPDGDFLDLDWIRNGERRLIVLTHGFEGNTRDPYMERSAAYFSERGYDILLWNLRSCSGELNRLPRFYHHGDIGDLQQVIQHAQHVLPYDDIVLVGFSLGGAIVLNFLGSALPKVGIKGAVVLSVPLDIGQTAKLIQRRWNRLLMEKNFAKIKTKVRNKAGQFPSLIDERQLDGIKTLEELNTAILLQLNGFSSERSYYDQWNTLQFLPRIALPTLIINALNDPLLAENDFPYALCEPSPHVFLETPAYGGHVGFTGRTNGNFWYLSRIQEFIESNIL